MAPSVLQDLRANALRDRLAAVAEETAALILPYWRSGTVARAKADLSPVTEADQRAEALILARLLPLYPEVGAVGEEMAADGGLPSSPPGDLYWLIDPLDGTRGFVEGKPGFTVNIALIHGDRTVAGVVSAPASGITWASGVDQGAPAAFRRAFGGVWEPVRVRPRPPRASAVVSHSLSAAEAQALADRYGCSDWSCEDSSLKFCQVAEGRFDAYPRTGPTSEWDTAAGQAVLEAAGGRVLAPDGGPLRYGKPGWRNGAFVALGG